MSAKQITIRVWKCRCNLPDCPGDGKPWISRSKKPPRACSWCKRITWNRPDRRVKEKTIADMTPDELREYNRTIQAESRKRKKQSATEGINGDKQNTGIGTSLPGVR